VCGPSRDFSVAAVSASRRDSSLPLYEVHIEVTMTPPARTEGPGWTNSCVFLWRVESRLGRCQRDSSPMWCILLSPLQALPGVRIFSFLCLLTIPPTARTSPKGKMGDICSPAGELRSSLALFPHRFYRRTLLSPIFFLRFKLCDRLQVLVFRPHRRL